MMQQHSGPYRVFLADDHNVVRKGLASLLESDPRLKVVGQGSTGEAVLETLEQQEFDLLIIDLQMPRMNGLETIRRIGRRTRPKILVLSMYDDPQFVAQALEYGARGYLLKNAFDEVLFAAIDAILRGERFICPSIDMSRVRQLSQDNLELTVREREVLQLIADGLTTQAVADALGISPHTATRHRANLMQKLGAHNQVELLRNASSKGLILMPQGLSDKG
jgi:DNA-binding NarL/FixJ family response regulator